VKAASRQQAKPKERDLGKAYACAARLQDRRSTNMAHGCATRRLQKTQAINHAEANGAPMNRVYRDDLLAAEIACITAERLS
jgi:hypothetical protein